MAVATHDRTTPGDLPAIAAAGPHLGRSLRVWRALRRVKQAHAAELLGIAQATVSRWESGAAPVPVEAQPRLRELLRARQDGAADRELARLVTLSTRPVHLVCDLTHTLLALSPARERGCLVPASELLGTSLWRHASREIRAAEARLPELGWYDPAPPAVEGTTGPNRSPQMRIHPSRFRWVRFQLSDGSFARTVETIQTPALLTGRSRVVVPGVTVSPDAVDQFG